MADSTESICKLIKSELRYLKKKQFSNDKVLKIHRRAQNLKTCEKKTFCAIPAHF